MIQYTLRDVSNMADRDLMELMSATFHRDAIPGWFYRPNPALDYEAPVSLVLEERDAELRDLLIKHGTAKLARNYSNRRFIN